jgi:type IV fimbrial biogenesis protein FimT
MTLIHTRAARPKQAGFTIIELMVSITVLGVLLGLGVPAFTNLIRNQRMATQTNAVVGALTYARAESAVRGQPVSICASNANRTGCDIGAESWVNGWIIFTDRGATPGDIDEGEVIIQTGDAPATGFAVSTTDSFIRFGVGSVATTARLFTVAPTSAEVCAVTQRREIDVSLTGRISTTREACE